MAITTTTNPKASLSPLVLLAVPLLGLLLYFATLDDAIINEGRQVTTYNLQVTDPAAWPQVWTYATPAQSPNHFAYRPVQALLLRMEWHAWQESPSSYHSLNLFLYLGILAVFLLLSGSLLEHPGARLAAAITLAVHPMFSQSVENIAAQGVLLSLLATLGACYVFQLYRQGVLRLRLGAALVSLLAFIAIGSHEMGFLLPVWLVALAALTRVHAPAASRKAQRKDAGEESRQASVNTRVLAFGIPLVVLIGLDLVMRHRALGAIFPGRLEGLGSAALAAPRVFCAYLFRLLWPARPTLFYPFVDSWRLAPPALLAWLIFLALLGLTILACRRGRSLGLALFFLVTPLLALSHWIPLPVFISEQPLAFALPGVALLVGAAVARLTVPVWTFPPSRTRDKAVVALLCIAWLSMAWQVWGRLDEWSKSDALMNIEAARHPRSAAPLVELIDSYVRQDAAEAARNTARLARPKANPAELDRIIELEATLAANQKDDPRLKELIDEALAQKQSSTPEHLERIAVLARSRDFKQEYAGLLRLQLKFYPNSFEALYGLAQVELDGKDYKSALSHGSKAIAVARGKAMQALALERYGLILAEVGQFPLAESALNQALNLDKTLYLPYIGLARIYWGRKDLESAKGVIQACFINVGSRVTSYRDLVELYTGVLETQNRYQEAVDWMIQRMDQFPADVPLQLFGARYLIEFGRYDRAEAAYRTLNQVPAARSTSGVDILVGMGLIAQRGYHDKASAATLWRKALEINPLSAEAKRFLDELDQGTASPEPKGQGTPAATPAPQGPASAKPGAPATEAATPVATPAPSSQPDRTPAPGSGLSLGVLSPASTPAPKPSPAAAPKPAPSVTPAATPALTPTATPAATPAPRPSPTPAGAPAATPVMPAR